MEEDGRPLVVLTTSPFHGHMTPILHAKGFPIAIAHSKLNPPNPSNHPPDFTFLQVLSDNLPAIEHSASFTNFLNKLNNNCKPSFKEHLTRLTSEGYKSIYDSVMFFAGVVAVDLNLPTIVFRTNSAAFFPALLARQHLTQQGRFLHDDFVMQDIVPNHHPLRYKDLPFSSSPIEDWRHLSSYSLQFHPSAVILNTIKFLEHESLTKIHNHFQVPVFAVGPLHKTTAKTRALRNLWKFSHNGRESVNRDGMWSS